MAALNLFFMLSTAAGIFAFGFFRGRVPAFPPAHAQLAAFCVNAACVAALVNILNVRPGFGLRYAALFLFTFSNGYITGSLFSQISRYIPAARQGFCIGASLASAHFFLFLSDTLVAVLHIPTPHALFFLFPVLALMAYLLKEYSNEPVDIAKVMLMCLIHDVVEIDAGDTYAYDADGLKTQKEREDRAKERIFSLLPEDQKADLIALFDEFEAYETPESKYAHAMDNLQPLILNNSNGGSDWKEHGVTSSQVYGRQSKTKLGSEKLYQEVVDKIIKEQIKKGNIKE
jgi:putative hydrolase of HD superfamily